MKAKQRGAGRLNWLISPLGSIHNRKAFDCGEQSLNRYLREYARQDTARNLSRVFVATRPERPDGVAGYYGLSAASLAADNLPDPQRGKLPKYPLPVALLGRLAVARSHQGQGLGRFLLADAMERISHASETLAVYAVVVDALNHRAAGFYKAYGFIALPSQPLKLFLPMKSVTLACSSSVR